MFRNIYKYSKGKLLENRNTYFYSMYRGKEFILAWLKSRKKILKKTNKINEKYQEIKNSKDNNLEKYLKNNREYNTEKLLMLLFNFLLIKENNDLVSQVGEKLLKCFEVTKRIYGEYNTNFKSIIKGNYKKIKLYLDLAEVFEVYYFKTKDIRFLNVLLKINDTLCAYFNDMSQIEKLKLKKILNKELYHIKELCNCKGLKL